MHKLCFLVLLSVFSVCFNGADIHAADGWTAATYNIRYANPRDGEDVWENRRQDVAKYVSGWEIIGMQEVTAAQMAYLREQLPGYDSYGVGRDDGKDGGEHSPIFWRKDRLESLDQGTFWLSETPDVVGKKSWDAALPRICSWAVLRDKESGQKLFVANTHFDHRGKLARLESAKLTVRKIPELAKGLPIVFMGDFNCTPGSEPYQQIVGGLQAAREISKSPVKGPDSTSNGFKAIAKGRIIDHVFVKGLDVDEYQVDDPRTAKNRFASDHLPVGVKLSLPSGQ